MLAGWHEELARDHAGRMHMYTLFFKWRQDVYGGGMDHFHRILWRRTPCNSQSFVLLISPSLVRIDSFLYMKDARGLDAFLGEDSSYARKQLSHPIRPRHSTRLAFLPRTSSSARLHPLRCSDGRFPYVLSSFRATRTSHVVSPT